jgi:hypothetical protein
MTDCRYVYLLPASRSPQARPTAKIDWGYDPGSRSSSNVLNWLNCGHSSSIMDPHSPSCEVIEHWEEFLSFIAGVIHVTSPTDTVAAGLELSQVSAVDTLESFRPSAAMAVDSSVSSSASLTLAMLIDALLVASL